MYSFSGRTENRTPSCTQSKNHTTRPHGRNEGKTRKKSITHRLRLGRHHSERVLESVWSCVRPAVFLGKEGKTKLFIKSQLLYSRGVVPEDGWVLLVQVLCSALICDFGRPQAKLDGPNTGRTAEIFETQSCKLITPPRSGIVCRVPRMRLPVAVSGGCEM